MGCVALADYLCAATWPSKFRPHLPEKFDGTTKLSEFLQVYVTAITVAGSDEAIMASYFHVALIGPARTWLMNLTPRSIQTWEELCTTLTASFASAYRQKSGESLRAFISHFTKVRGTIPQISDASVITAFCQEVRDKKMLEKLATHEVESVTSLFSLADKCAMAAEGRAWHSAPQDGANQAGGSSATPQGGGKKNKKNRDRPRLPVGSTVTAAAAGGQNPRTKCPRPYGSCPVHPDAQHSAADCREIQKLARHFKERREQTSKEGSPSSPGRRPGKEKVSGSDATPRRRSWGTSP